MTEIITSLGVPALVVAVLGVGAAIVNQYYQHILKLREQAFSAQLQLIQAIHLQRWEAVRRLSHLNSELFHQVRHVQDGDMGYRADVELSVKALRSYVRENSLILGDNFEQVVYRLTDAARAVLEGDFDKDVFWEAHRELLTCSDDLLMRIPNIEKALPESSRRSRVLPKLSYTTFLRRFSKGGRQKLDPS